MELYSIFDIKAREYSAPFLMQNEVVAIRSVKVGLPPDHLARKYSGDFELVLVGSFDQETGLVSGAQDLERRISMVTVFKEVSDAQS